MHLQDRTFQDRQFQDRPFPDRQLPDRGAPDGIHGERNPERGQERPVAPAPALPQSPEPQPAACERGADAIEALERLYEAQKEEAIGRLTGGVAHDFNNLLAAILSNLELIRKRVTDLKTAKLVDGAIKGAERGAELTRRLLHFARRQELKPQPIDLMAWLAERRDLLSDTVGWQVRIETEIAPDLPLLLADPETLELALLNLAVNARDAMPQGGTLTIVAQQAERDFGSAAGRQVRLRVKDSGLGMDEATLRRAAEPFFTTKGTGKGSGLGLSMVQGFAMQSGGAFRITSRKGHGTTVELLLPIADPACLETPSPSSPATDPAEGATRLLRVLVVDDDALVGMGTAAMLEDLGHEALTALGGPQALLLLERESVDVLITDHQMPGMTGLELAALAAQRHPGLPIALATGFTDLPGGEAAVLPRLSKPFRQDELSRVLAELKPRA